MEAVPRMPMMSFDLKNSPEYVEFGPTLKKYISEHYGEDPAHYNKSCNELEQLRQSVVHVSLDFMGCSTLKKYYAQLQFLQGRFPMLEGGEAAIAFTWEEVHSGREMTWNDIKFEQACVLYNIGALHSLLGALDTRHSADGMKVSCTHFQCAAWALEYLRDHFGCSSMSIDMSHELLTFNINLMLAQAQECILEKSMIDSRKSTITAKVAAQIVEFYRTAMKHLDSCNTQELIPSKRYKKLKKKIEIKVLFYICITNYCMGQQSQDQQKWGQSLAYYTLALEKLGECEKMATDENDAVHNAIRFAHDVVGGKYQAAKKDNDFVYHEKVPAADTLPEVKGASLVKGIPFNPNDPDISGPDIFQKLVPMSAHEAASLYSEEKATLLRRIASEIAEKNEELNQYLASLQLDQTTLNPEPERLPQQLLEKCAALSVRPTAIKDLVDSMTAVSNVATDVDLGIKEIQHMLQEESKAELEFQAIYGNRNPNAILSEIAKECARFEEGHKKGSQSNFDLHKAMNTHIKNLKLLTSPLEDLQKLLPSVDKDRDAESNDIIQRLNVLLSKIEEMRTQRQKLEDELRKDILADDITGVLCKQEGTNREVLFSEQIKKHDKTTSLIRQNLSAQNNILKSLTDANAKYAFVRKATSDALMRREQVIRDLISSYDVYEDLKAKSQKGLEFYKKLETNVERLLQKCKNVCKVQQEERDKMCNKYQSAAFISQKPTVSKASPLDTRDGTMTDTRTVDAVANPATSYVTVAAMFDGPKLKDYLPFMKPKTFGKKTGSPPISTAHPSVQEYLAQGGGSLPNSGTASPVHMQQMPGSMPASPDHFRSNLDKKLVPIRPSVQQVGSNPTEGYTLQQFSEIPSSIGQGQMVRSSQAPLFGQQVNMYPTELLSRPESTFEQEPRQDSQRDQGLSGIPQGYSQSVDSQSLSQTMYVPLDQKWKNDVQTLPHTSYLSQSQPPPVSRLLKPRGTQLSQNGIQQPSEADLQAANQAPLQSNMPVDRSMAVSYNPHRDAMLSSQMSNQGFNQTLAVSSCQQVLMQGSHDQWHYDSQSMGVPFQPVVSQQTSKQPVGNMPMVSSQMHALPVTSDLRGINGTESTSDGLVAMANMMLPAFDHCQNSFCQGQVYVSQDQGPLGQIGSIYQQGFDQNPRNQQLLPFQPEALVQQQNSTSCQPPTESHSQPSFPCHTFQTQQTGHQNQRFLPAQAEVHLPAVLSQGQLVQGHLQSQDQSFRVQQQASQQFQPTASSALSQPQQVCSVNLPYKQSQCYQQTQLPVQQTQLPVQQTQLLAHQTQLPLNQKQFTMQQPFQQQPQLAIPEPIQGHGHLWQTPNFGQETLQNIQTTQVQLVPQSIPGQNFQQPQYSLAGQENRAQLLQQQFQQPVIQPNPAQSQQPVIQLNPAQLQQPVIQPNPAQSQQPVIQPNPVQSQQQIIQPKPTQSQQPVIQSHPVQSQQPVILLNPVQSQQPVIQPNPAQQAQQYYGQQNIIQLPPSASQVHSLYTGSLVQAGSRFVAASTQPSNAATSASAVNMSNVTQPLQSNFQGQTNLLQGQQQFEVQGQTLTANTNVNKQVTQIQASYATQGQSVSASRQEQTLFPYNQSQASQQQVIMRSEMPGQGGMFYPGGHYSLNQGQIVQRSDQYYYQMPQQQSLNQQNIQSVSDGGAQTILQPQVLEPTSFRKNQTHSQIQSQKLDVSNIQISQGQSHSDQKLQNTPQLTPVQTQMSMIGSDKQIPMNLPPGLQPQITSSALSMVKQQDHSRPCSPVEVRAAQSGIHRQMSQSSDLKYTSPVHVPVNRQLSTASSLDDILSSSPDDCKTEKAESVLAPKVLTAQDIQQQKEDLLKHSSHENLPIDPYKDKSKLSRFAAEVDKLAKFVEGFEKPLCKGPTPLDIIWKELTEEQEKAMRQQKLSIARCYPMKNRDQDIMPYDNTRVLLTSLKDDYINASWINDLSPSCPKFIATQAPLSVTLIDFWAMVYEQGVEVLVALSSDIEVGKKFPPYLPKEKGEIMDHGSVQLILQSVKQKLLWTERIIHLRHAETKTGRTLVHLHYNCWPISGFPEKVSYILQFITEVHSFYRQQRSFMKPIVVHCGNGVGRTGMFQLIYVGMQVINHGDRIINIPEVAKDMLWKRRNMLVKKDQLKFCYEAILYYAQDILAKEGILVHKASFGDQLPKPGAKVQGWEPGQDILFGSMSFTNLQTNVAKLGTRKNDSTSANSNDEKLQTLKSDEVGEQNKINDKDSQISKENLIFKQPFDTSSLPDVVQNQGLNLERKNKESTIVNALCETKLLVDLDSNVTQIKDVSQIEAVPVCILDDVKSKEDISSLEYFESVKASKTALTMPVNKGAQPGSVSLVELQDPTKFELGTSEGNKKKKITKADFLSEKKLEKDIDLTDPFNSLDPLWSVKK